MRGNELYETVTTEVEESRRTTEWKKKEARAQKIIVTTMAKSTLVHVMSCTTAYQMWAKIRTVYKRDNEQQTCNFLQTFYSSGHEEGSNISTHIGKLKNIAYRLNALDAKVDDRMLI